MSTVKRTPEQQEAFDAKVEELYLTVQREGKKAALANPDLHHGLVTLKEPILFVHNGTTPIQKA